jgi:hypothetical protein
MCNVQALVTNGIPRMSEDTEVLEESLTVKYVLSCGYRLDVSVSNCTNWLCQFTCLLYRCRQEYRVFQKLLGMVPHLTECLMNCSNEESMAIADLVCPLHSNIDCFVLLFLLQVQKGVSNARSDDTKSMKGAVLDWITPRDVPLNPPLSHNVKTNCGFHNNTTGVLLCPAGTDWDDPK